MGWFSPKKKSLTLWVLPGSSGQPLPEIWGVLRSSDFLTAVTQRGLEPDETSLMRTSNAVEMSETYNVLGRPGVTIKWFVERYSQPGYVTVTVEGDQASVDAARDAFTSTQSFVAQELPGVMIRISAS